MASTFDKKFKTTETTKAAGAEVVSDPIELSPRTKNHILTVTTDNSLSGTVDVEMEMSPDGNNWCPAVSRTVTGGAGSATGNVIGNEESVKLTPDAGEFRNKHARGGLNFDVNGAAVSPDGSGSRDLLQQHMATTKSFNYSQWFKTSELPSDGQNETVNYTVAVGAGVFNIDGSAQLTLRLKEGSTYTFDQSDSTNANHPLKFSTTSNGTHAGGSEYTTGVTYNGVPGQAGAYTRIVVAASAPTLYYYCGNHSGMGGTAETPVNSVYKPVLFRHAGYDDFSNAKTVQLTDGTGAGTLSNTKDAMGVSYNWDSSITSGLLPSDSFTIAWWVDLSKLNSGATNYSGMQNISNTNANGIYSNHIIYGSNFHNRWYSNLTWRNGPSPANQNNYYTITDWTASYFVVTRVDASAGVGNTATTHHDIFKDDGTHVHNFQSSFTIPSGYTVGAGVTWTAQSTYTNADEMVMLDSFISDANLSTLYDTVGSAIKPKDFAAVSGVNGWYRIGDNATDDLSDAKNFKGTFPDLYSSNSGALTALSTSDNLYMAGAQKTTQNLSKLNSENKAIQITGTGATNGLDLTASSGSHINPFKLNSNLYSTSDTNYFGNTTYLPSIIHNSPENSGIVCSFQFKFDSTANIGQEIIRVTLANGEYIRCMININGGTLGLFTYYSYNSGANELFLKKEGLSITAGQWNHVVFRWLINSAGNNNQYYTRFGFNGTEYLPGGGSFNINTSLINNTTHSGSAVSTVKVLDVRTASNTLQVDNLCMYHGSPYDGSANRWDLIYANRNNPTATPTIGGCRLTAAFKMGDGPEDTLSPVVIKDIVEPSSYRQMTIPSTSTNTTIATLTSADDPYVVQMDQFTDVFSTSTASSISGWFKTSDTGTLFSNTGGAAATGMVCNVTATNIGLAFLDGTPSPIVAMTDVDDGNWHHIVVTKNTSQEFKIYIDGIVRITQTATGLTDADLTGDNGFTLLGDGQNNAGNSTPAATDASKLQATLSNWSLHKEALNANAVKQLYSNGNVRNIKNLPDVNATLIKAWWQLNDATNPQNDVAGINHLKYVDSSASSPSNLTSYRLGGNFFIKGNTSSDQVTMQQKFSVSYWFRSLTSASGDLSYSNAQCAGFSRTDGSTITVGSGTHRKGFKYQFRNYATSNNYNFISYGGVSVKFARPANLIDQQWHHVAITWDPTVSGANIDTYNANQTMTVDQLLAGTKLYINGNAITLNLYNSSGTATTENTDEPMEFNLGDWLGGGFTGDRDIYGDEVGFWKGHTLTSTEVTQSIYNGGTPGLLTSLSNNPTRYYQFENDPDPGYDTISSSGGKASYYSTNQHFLAHATSGSTGQGTGSLYGASVDTSNLVNTLVNADGPTYVNGSINGNGITMSLTKSFNFTTNKWVEGASQDTAICVSFNGFEEQAEYFAIWKCTQTVGGSTIDICDGNWHNVILSYRGRNNLSGDNVDPGDVVKFGPGPANSLAFNWALSFDGEPLTAMKDGSGADYIGGLNTITTDSYSSTTYNVGFPIQDRHLKYISTNTEEVYKPHAQFSAGIHEVSGVDNVNAFQGYVDETSFHSDTWWVDQAGTSIINNTFNQEKPATIFGNTTALSNRQGAGTEYPQGKPYPLLNPEKLTTSGLVADIAGTNQYINPNRYDASTNPHGGLEGWWRWGDTPGDCSITINDVRDHGNAINSRDIDAKFIVTADRQIMASSDSIYLSDTTGSSGGGGTVISFPQVKLEGIQQGVCNLRNINSPLLQYVRVRIKGAGSMDLGEGKGQARLNYTNRRRRRKK